MPIRARKTWARLANPILVATVVAGCTGRPGDSEVRGVLLHLKGADHPQEVVCVVTLPDGPSRVVEAEPGASDRAVCATPPEARRPGVMTLTVKAIGFRFSTRTFETSNLPLEGGLLVVDWPLEPLPAPVTSADYATGFDASATAEAFETLATPMPTELGAVQVVKFTILDLPISPTVYFQQTRRHPLHYAFVHDVLGIPVSLEEFERTTYHGLDRTAMAGTLVSYPNLDVTLPEQQQRLVAPIILEFFPNDDLTPEQVVTAHRLLEERMPFLSIAGLDHRLVYLPAGQVQEDQAASKPGVFAVADVPWIRRLDLYGNAKLQVLNPGLAYGRLRLLSADDLKTTVVSYQDILVLTHLPVELPLVGGTITEEFQTPLAHVNVAARTRGTPNIALAGASRDPRVAPFLGKMVRFEVKDGTFTLEETSIEAAEEFWGSRHPETSVPQADLDFDSLAGFADLGFEDSVRVGAKAANLAELSHLLPGKSPIGFAVPFRYYEQFMIENRVDTAACHDAAQDCVNEGRSEAVCAQAEALCDPPGGSESLMDHARRLISDAGFRSDSELREAALDGMRFLVKHGRVDEGFASALTARVSGMFGDAKVRLRSSTNAEDLQGFSGAGLYDSVSAYATGTKAVQDRIRDVWASVWNWRAFEERSWWGIDHLAVRMGVAVTESFPDEAANGVLITQNISDPVVAGMYVNVQVGETSVTNPEGGALPEVFVIVPGPDGLQVARQRYSSLSPGTPILSEREVYDLYQAAAKVQSHFAPLYGKDPAAMALDIEFKFHGPERALYLKQVRPYTVAGWEVSERRNP